MDGKNSKNLKSKNENENYKDENGNGSKENREIPSEPNWDFEQKKMEETIRNASETHRRWLPDGGKRL